MIAKVESEQLVVAKFDDFVDHIYNGGKPKDVRIGQWAFSLLERVRPVVANEVRGGIFDPFYKNFVSPEFLDFVKKRW